MRQRFCKVCGGWHALDRWPHNCMPEQNWAASDLPSPSVISDTMGAVQSQLDGRMYDSKSRLRETYRAAGVIEVGNDAQRMKPRQRAKVDRKQVRDAIGKAKAEHSMGRRPDRSPPAA